MNILLINHYAGSIRHGMEYRPYYLAREWVRRGHRVYIVAATCSHLRRLAPDIGAGAESGPWTEETIDGIRYLWLRTPPYRGNGAARVRNMLAFVLRLWRDAPQLARSLAPHIVIASSTYPLDIWPAHRIARLAGARLLHEIHDLWPLSPMALGGYSRHHPFIMLLQAAETHACRHADAIVSILPRVREHLEARGMAPDKLHIIPNGVDPDEWQAPATMPRGCGPGFEQVSERLAGGTGSGPGTGPGTMIGMCAGPGAGTGSRIAASTVLGPNASRPTLACVISNTTPASTRPASPRASAVPSAATTGGSMTSGTATTPALTAMPSPAQLPPDLDETLRQLRERRQTIVAYTGSHGVANALDTLLDAARLVHDHPLAFLLVGAGPEKERLQQKAQRRELTQVHFAGPVAKHHMPALLGNIDIAFLGWQRQPLYRFGIAPNKLLDYMMAGCPVLHAVAAGNDPVAEAGCGVSVAPEDPVALAHGLLRLLEMGSERRRALGARGRRYVLAHLTYPVLAQRFLDLLEQEVSHG